MKKLLVLTLGLLALVGCSNPSSTTSEQLNSGATFVPESTETSTSEVPSTSLLPSTSEDDEIIATGSAIINLKDSLDLTGKLSDEAPNKKFVDYINFHTTPGFLVSIEANHASEIKLYKNEKGIEESLLSLGSRKTNGYITFTFSKEITELNLYARPCYKFYNNEWHNDLDVSLKVDVDDVEKVNQPLTQETGSTKKAELTLVNVKFDEPTYHFTVSNVGDITDDVGNRLFLEKMELEFND